MRRQLRPESLKKRRLANRIARILSVFLVCVFVCLIGTVTLQSGNGMREAISDEFGAMAKGTGMQVQSILRSAENSANAVVLYLQNDFKTTSETTKDNMFQSAIYGKPISEGSYEAEKYITQTVRQSVKSSEDIVGMGVLFEPYAFDKAIEDYSFYLSDDTADQPPQPYLSYAEYSQQEYYSEPSRQGTTHITAPYQDAGYTMVTFCQPILVGGEMRGVITADINVGEFSKTIFETEKYPSKYTTIIDNDGIIVYDTESLANVGGNLTEFIVDKAGLKKIQEGIRGSQPFSVDVVREDGTTETSFYYPIEAGQTKWWSITALQKTDLNKSVTITTTVLIVLSAAALLLTVVALSMIIKKMLLPIDAVAKAAEQIAGGNLEIELHADTQDEIGRLVTAFSSTIQILKGIIADIDQNLEALATGEFRVDSQCQQYYVGGYTPILSSMRLIRNRLNTTLGQISQSADQVAAGGEQVSSGAQALSQGATEQASSVEELAATISEISSQVKDTAGNAELAHEQSAKAGDEVTACNGQMMDMISAMEEISQKSTEIKKIIKTIEDIAFQTNILALNAAVEAARAGAAGKGFAVVADEVRSLASKSAEASQNTSALIAGTIEAVEKGTKIASETADSLARVVQDTQSVAETVDRITIAASEQAQSIMQVTQGVDQISAVVQTNSATAQESAAASEELSGQAQMLKSLVGQFHLMEEGALSANG